eukprot:UN04168
MTSMRIFVHLFVTFLKSSYIYHFFPSQIVYRQFPYPTMCFFFYILTIFCACGLFVKFG